MCPLELNSSRNQNSLATRIPDKMEQKFLPGMKILAASLQEQKGDINYQLKNLGSPGPQHQVPLLGRSGEGQKSLLPSLLPP